MRAHPFLRAVLAALALLAAACHAPRPTTVPIPTLRFDSAAPGSGPPAHPCLVVFLPGRYDRPQDFAGQGFVADLRASGAACDAVAVDSHLGYFADRSIVRRLHEDVIAPARERGYREIWLAGISLGGLGSLIYIREHPGEVTGAMLIAPYLGEPEVVREIEAAGGVARWTPPAAPAEDDVGRQVWTFLKETYAAPPGGASPSSPRPALPPLYLGYGNADRFASADALLAALLPGERVFTAPGGHDWPPWRAIWRAFLARGVLPAAGAARSGTFLAGSRPACRTSLPDHRNPGPGRSPASAA